MKMETNWSDKSNINIASAELLFNNENYCSVVHSCYYSNILLMFHVLHVFLNMSEDQIEIEREDGSRINKGSHNWLKTTINFELNKIDCAAFREFNNQFGELKRLRIIADYKNEKIEKDDAGSSIKKAKRINEILIGKFNL